MVTNLWQALTGPYLKQIIARFWPFLLTAIIGVWIGIQVLATVRSDYLVAMLGVVLILNSLISFTPVSCSGTGAGTRNRLVDYLLGIWRTDVRDDR